MLQNEKLKKVSDYVFQEAEPPKDRHKPLGWRRRFNLIKLPLKNINIVTGCEVHKVECEWKLREPVNPLELVKADISDYVAITGILDEDQMQDSIYCAVEDKKEKGIFSIKGFAGLTKITLHASEPSEGDERVPDGLYWGTVQQFDFEDELYFNFRIPKVQMQILIAALRKNQNATIDMTVHLPSFTYEIDDFFLEPNSSRRFLINSWEYCFVAWIAVLSKIGEHSIRSESENEDSGGNPHVLLSYLKSINNLVTVLWALVVVIIMYALNIFNKFKFY